MTHISDELPRLLTGEASRAEVLAAAEHLPGCPDCLQELVSALVAHSSLTSARRFAPELAVPAGSSPAATPDLTQVFAQARGDAARPRRRLVVGAAAAAAVIAGVITSAVVATGGSSSNSRTVALAPYDVGTRSASATLGRDGTMRIDATSLPRPHRRQFYEVWLTNADRTRLQAIGSIGAANRAVLTVSPNVMSHYTAIEVSVQGVNQTSYSGTSLLRGTYG